MKGKTLKKLGIAIVIIGGIVCMWPSITNEITGKEMKSKIEKFVEETSGNSNVQISTLDKMREEFEEYNKELSTNGQKLVDAFSYQDTNIDLSRYGYSENIVGYINIPNMDVVLPIYLGATKQNLKKGATLLSQTSIPIGGNNTNSVIAAHRNMTTSKMFRNIEKLKIGDEIIITNAWEELKYEVIQTKVISPDNIEAILIQEGKELITLVTCHPYGRNTQRYLVYAEKK